MSLGRQVADAYIDVHGDLSDFRRDLEKAKGSLADWARDEADSFSDAFAERMKSQWGKQWGSIVDMMQSGTKVDFNRMVENFDLNDLDAASEKIHEMLRTMQESGKLSETQMRDTANAVDTQIKALQRQHFIEQDLANDRAMWGRAHEIMMAQLADAQEKASKTMEEAFRENERWARSFEGIRKNDAISKLNEDFRKLATAMNDADIASFAKNFGSFDEMRDRVVSVTDAMIEQGRISRENADGMLDNINRFIEAEIRLEETTKATTAEVERAKLEAERFKVSLEGMVDAAKKTNLEKDFRAIADAIATTDWSRVARGHDDMEAMRDRIAEVSLEMYRMGRISDAELGNIGKLLADMRGNAESFNLEFGKTEDGIRRASGDARLLQGFMRGAADGAANLAQKVAGMSGLNLVTDMFRAGGEFMRNFDRNAVHIAKMVTLSGTLVSTIGAALGGMAVIGQDLAKLSGIALLAPGFLAGAGIGIGVLVAAFKDMKTVLKDLGPQFSKLQDAISKNFWEQAEQPIRNLVKNLMPTLETQLANTATKMGDLFGELASSLQGHATPERVTRMFERMNDALVIVKKAVDPLVEAFVQLGETGSEYFGRAADAIVGMSEDFNRFIMDAAASGELNVWIEDAIQGFKDVGSIIGSTAGILDSIGDAASRAGIGGLSEFAAALERADEVMSSDRFQGGMTRLFEGMKGAVKAVTDSIARIGPDIEAAIPTISGALETIGQIAGKVIEHAGTILSNPKFLNGVTGFVNGIKSAVEKLTPAMGPIADSLGGLLSLMGRLLPPIAELISYVYVNLGPIFDSMLTALEPLVKPTTEFVKEIIKLTAPALKTFAETTLPGLVSFASQLYTPLLNIAKVLTPAFATVLDDIGYGFKNAAEGLKALNGEANSFKAPWDNPPPKPEDWNIDWGKASDNSFWDDLGAILAQPLGADQGKAIMEAWGDDIAGFFPFLGEHIANGFNIVVGDIGKRWDEIWSGQADLDLTEKLKEMFPDQAEVIQGIQDFFDGIFDGIAEAWNGLLEWIGSLFGGGGEESSAGGGIGTMSPGGKITPEMLGIGAPEENWLESLITAVTEGISSFFTGVGENIALFGQQIKTGWDEFWGGLGTRVSEVWTEITTWLSTKYAEITTNIQNWWTGLKAGWDGFWGSLPAKVQEVWNTVTTWIATKAAEIGTNISSFITTVRTSWDAFWTTVRTKVQETWNQVTSWIGAKVGEIRTNIQNFITTVQANWNSFWTTVWTKVSSIWGQITAWISGRVAAIRATISGFVSGVQAQWNSFWETVRQRVSTAWDQMVQAVQSGVNNVMSFIRGLPGQIAGALGGLGGLLTGAGSAIMDGLRRGIEAGFEAVKGVVGGIAGWIRDNKGPISYDRILLIPAGEAIMEGLQTGLENRMGSLASALHEITGNLVDTVTEGFAKSRMYAAGAEAALGLADGLAANSSAVSASLEALVPALSSELSVTGRGAALPLPESATVAGARIINVAEGAIRIDTPTKDPGLLASRVIDDLADFSNF